MSNQPKGRMTIMSLPEHLRGIEWGEPQEIEVRVAGELVLYGLSIGMAVRRIETSCANPDCEGCGVPRETLQIEIDIAPDEEDTNV
jgi:hypothetical protein